MIYAFLIDPSLTALANEVEALRAALLQREQQVANLTRSLPLPVHPPLNTSSLSTQPVLVPTQMHVPQVVTFGGATTPGLIPVQPPVPQVTTSVQPPVPQVTTSGFAVTPGLVSTQTYLPRMVPAVAEGGLSGTSTTRTIPAMSTLVSSLGGLNPQVHHHHYFTNTTFRGRSHIRLLISIM